MSSVDTDLLETAEEWDLDGGEVQGPPTHAVAVVAVSFETTEFTLLAEAAAAAGQSVVQFIHDAAVERAEYGTTRPLELTPDRATPGSPDPADVRREASC